MPEKRKKTRKEDAEKTAESSPENVDEKASYYYDDAHGYQVYTGEEDDDQFEDDEGES